MAVTTSNLDGFFKVRYTDDKLRSLIPSFNVLSQKIAFSRMERTGKSYLFPVRTQRGMGVTFNGGATYGNAFSLNGAKSGATQEATVTGTEMVIEEDISYRTISAAREAGKAAFGNAFDEIVGDMVTTAAFFREMAILYGGSSIGTITGTPVQPTATTAELIISAATWAPGLWVQMIGGYVDVYDSVGGTKQNSNAVLEVTDIDVDTRTVTVSGNATDIDALGDTEVIVARGADGNLFSGVDAIMTNTGTLFGIDASTTPSWNAQTYAAGGAALTMAKLNAAAAKITVASGMRDLTAIVSTYTWNDLNNDQTSLRRFGESIANGVDNGTRGKDGAIRYHGPSGTITVCPSPMCKAGEAFLLDLRTFKRVGSTDTTFRLPGMEGKGQQPNFFHELNGQAGVGLRAYWDQALVCRAPNANAKITGIVNTVS